MCRPSREKPDSGELSQFSCCKETESVGVQRIRPSFSIDNPSKTPNRSESVATTVDIATVVQGLLDALVDKNTSASTIAFLIRSIKSFQRGIFVVMVPRLCRTCSFVGVVSTICLRFCETASWQAVWRKRCD